MWGGDAESLTAAKDFLMTVDSSRLTQLLFELQTLDCKVAEVSNSHLKFDALFPHGQG